MIKSPRTFSITAIASTIMILAGTTVRNVCQILTKAKEAPYVCGAQIEFLGLILIILGACGLVVSLALMAYLLADTK